MVRGRASKAAIVSLLDFNNGTNEMANTAVVITVLIGFTALYANTLSDDFIIFYFQHYGTSRATGAALLRGGEYQMDYKNQRLLEIYLI